MMNDLKPLPAYTKETLAELSPSKLIDLIIEDADRTPRNVIDECARREETMTEYLQQLHKDGLLWSSEDNAGLWWLRLHAVMILGLIPSERAGLLLVDLMRRMSVEEDENLQDWLAGNWAAFFENKPESAVSALRDLASDGKLDWYLRANAIDPVFASAARQGDAALEQALAWLAEMAADEKEDWDFRLSAAGTMLQYPCGAYKSLLENLASRQTGWGKHFDMDEVRKACAGQRYEPDWKRFRNPWKFYEPNAIAQRQKRWHEEDMKANQAILAGNSDDFYDDDFSGFDFEEPYIRPEPKTGRNDPCPCGSGKKYKKCCLVNE